MLCIPHHSKHIAAKTATRSLDPVKRAERHLMVKLGLVNNEVLIDEEIAWRYTSLFDQPLTPEHVKATLSPECAR